MRHVASLLLLALVVLAPVRDTGAQTAGAVVGIVVRDPAERPIAEAIVSLEGHDGPQVRTNREGIAAIVSVKAGSYRLRAIRAGYLPIVRQLSIAATDTIVTLVMTPTAARLSEVQIIASRATGVFGKVARAKDWTTIADATVTVFGGRTLRSDSTGSFEMPELRAGAYLLRVERDGFVPQMRSVSVPDSGAVEVAVLLDSGAVRPLHPPLLVELGQRQRWRGIDSAIIPRDELTRYARATLTSAIRGSPSFVVKGLRIENDACLFVDGVPRPGWPVDAFAPEQVEAVEVYAGRSETSRTLGRRWPAGTPCGSSTAVGRTTRRSDQVTMVVIWLKPEAPR